MQKLAPEKLDELAQRFFAGEGSVEEEARQWTRAELQEMFSDNIVRIQEVVSGMTPAQLLYRPPGAPSGPDSSGDEEHFDTSQVVTHLAAGIVFHWWGIARALGHPRPVFPQPPEGATLTAKKGKIMGAGGWRGASAPELAALLGETSERFLQYVDALPEKVEGKATSSLGIFRDLSPHGWLFIEVVHTGMHLKQILDIQDMA